MVVIQDKMKVSIAYTLREGSRILEEVPVSQPFVYIHGYNNIIPGLENTLTGRRLGERFTVNIPANLGYGEYRKDLILTVPKDELRDVGELWLGMELEMFQDSDIREFQLPDTAEEFVNDLNLDEDDDQCDGIFTIKEILEDTVVVDGNHPFAGKNLTFNVEVVDITEASFTEQESGFPDEDDYDEYNNRLDDDNLDSNERRWR